MMINPSKIRDMNTFGERLYAWCEKKGVTMYRLARLINVSDANLSSIKKGKRPASDEVLKRIAAVPELEISYELLRAWQRLDGATEAEKVEIVRELLSPEEFQVAVKQVMAKKGLLE